MALRQYHTPTGTYLAEPSQKELDMEWEMKKNSPDFQMMKDTIAELTGKTVKEVEATMKKNYKG
jgi:ATP-dependent protease ClpP protease subunit